MKVEELKITLDPSILRTGPIDSSVEDNWEVVVKTEDNTIYKTLGVVWDQEKKQLIIEI